MISSENDSILTKLNDYPYEFEIDGKLRLASINGIKVSSNDTSYDELKKEIDNLKATIQSQSQRIKTLEDETIVDKRINLMNTPVEIPISTSQIDRNIDIPLSGSIEEYKYIEIQIDVHYTPVVDNHLEKTILIATEQLNYNNSDTVNWGDNSTFIVSSHAEGNAWAQATAWFKDNKTLRIGNSFTGRTNWDKLRIRKIYGIK